MPARPAALALAFLLPLLPLAAAAQPAPAAPPAAAPAEVKPAPLASEAVELAPLPALTYPGETDWDDAEKALSEAVNALYAAAAKAKLEVAGPPMIEYLDTAGAEFRFTGFLPLKAAPDGALPDGVKAGTTPAGRARRFVHQGAYEELEDVYSRIDEQIAADGKTMKRVIEEYVSDPAQTKPDQMVTNIYIFTE